MAAPRMPGFLTVSAQRYKVEEVDEPLVVPQVLTDADGVEHNIEVYAQGLCDSYALKIVIMKTIDGRTVAASRKATTLAHEALHAMFEEADLDQDEKIIGPLAPILVDTLRRNPALVKYLVSAGATEG